jgi:hypothetical protein
MADAIAVKKDGAASKARIKLIHQLLAERMTGESVRHYVNDAMRWGLEKEPEALRAYEIETGEIITPGYFLDHPEIDNFGATPDGFLAHGGLIETKCPTTVTYVEWVLANVVPEEHKPQMLAQLACTRRRWVDFVAFDPRVHRRHRQIFIKRFEPSAEEIAGIEAKAVEFLAEVDAMWEQLTTGS